ncbi:hypothetical protein SCUCBS95973_004570 [Sporothrix curviconia]|uniref:Uncharacterized protein n=1 Tax=Sporothrix curviconia TaxID=1260050 RepID=A0ABP0BPR6_9PEZI
MAPGSPLLVPHHSPTRKSSQELPLFPVSARSADAPPLSLSSPRKQTNGLHNFNGTSLLAIPEPASEPAADLTPSLIAHEMDVDNGTTTVAEAAAAQQAQQQVQQVQQAQQTQQTQQIQQQPPVLVAPQPSRSLPQTRTLQSPVRTPELQTTLPQRQATNGHGYHSQQQQQQQQQRQHSQRGVSQARESSPGTPGHIPPFDWETFEARYEQALQEMNGEEKELLEEFDRLVNYFNVWASAASAHDDERAVKRLQTRERYVKIAEQSLGQRKQHLTEVVRAFQSALALLSQT